MLQANATKSLIDKYVNYSCAESIIHVIELLIPYQTLIKKNM